MNNKIKPRLSILASAGSGKTYTLAQRFIQLLSFIGERETQAISVYQLGHKQNDIPFNPPSEIGSIVALTFTNKAADEMGERIVRFLKVLAGIYDEQIGNKDLFMLNKEKALRFLFEIIKNRTNFNVSTIDSFTNKILRAFAVDLNINPDYDITFDSEEIFDYAFQKFVSDKDNFELLTGFLEDLLKLDETGFNGERIIKRSLKNFELPNGDLKLVTYEDVKGLVCKELQLSASSFDELKSKLESLINAEANAIDSIILRNDGAFNKRGVRPYLNIDVKKLKDQFERYQNLINTGSVSTLLKKGKAISEADQTAFLDSLEKILLCYRFIVLSRAVYKSLSTVEVLKKFNKLKEDIKRSLNVVELKQVTNDILRILGGENGVSYAFCKLGERINHYLIDEFQDTSKEQFEAMLPLLNNAKDEGGTIFVVGDKKQAIYAWRGGDYTIFNRLKPLGLDEDKIKTNFRSKRAIVEFSNWLFGEMKNVMRELNIEPLAVEEIEEVYRQVQQEISDCNNEGGYVEVVLKEKSDDMDEFYKEQIVDILKNKLRLQGGNRNVMILLRTKDQIRKVVNFIREALPEVNIITEDALMLLSNFEVKKLLVLAKAAVQCDSDAYRLIEELNIRDVPLEILSLKAKQLSPYEFFSYLLSLDIFDVEGNQSFFAALMEKVIELQSNNLGLTEIVDYLYEHGDITVKVPEYIDAIRIMTIHKAKGLEAHTVIVPFYQWNVSDKVHLRVYDFIGLDEIEGKKIFAYLDKDLRNISKEAQEKFSRKYIANLVESLNLMYVANTRAKQNLFIIGSYTKKGSVVTAGDIVYRALFYGMNGGVCLFKRGTLEPIPSKEEKPVKSTHLKTKESLRRYLKVFPEVFEIGVDFSKKRRGDLFHRAMSFIGIVDDFRKLRTLAEEAYAKASVFEGYEDKSVIEEIVAAVNKLKDYFSNIDAYWNEKEVIGKDGKILRIDRLVKKNGKFYVIDYKTGSRRRQHIEQVREYLANIPNSKGIVYYSSSQEVIYV